MAFLETAKLTLSGLPLTQNIKPKPSVNNIDLTPLNSAAGWLVTDRDADERCRPFARRPWELRSLMLTPIAGSGGVLGLLVLGHPEPHRFDVNHLNLAEGIARQTAQAIVNLRHREEQQSRARLGRQMVKF
ncbi:MAG: GAF domain-containing protein [Verrucomicrobiota bacterium]